jgi:hypothetical protein
MIVGGIKNMKKVLCIRASALVYQKLLDLVKLHGTQTEAVAFAIENLWQKEIGAKHE